MNRRNSISLNGMTILGTLVILGLLAGCTAVGTGSNAAQGLLQLDNGVVKIKNQEGELEPVATDSAFELVGTLESVEPWKVAGRALQRNEATQITQGVKVGDLVRVRGMVLEDGNWLAYSIEPAEQQANQNQTITMIGRVTSTEPLVVNGTTLNVTGDTVIKGTLTPGMLVKVEILLLADGTWEVISVSPLGDLPSTTGCATVTATVNSVNGNTIQFLGWPTTVNIGDDGVDVTTLKPGQQVLAVICVSENNQVVITKITILDDDNDSNETDGGEKVLICHKPDKKGGHTISVSSAAVPAHLGHGDKLGACP